MSPKKDSDVDDDYSDTEGDPRKLLQLGEAVINLHKRPQIKNSSITEPSSRIAEFNLIKPRDDSRISINEFSQAFKKGSKNADTAVSKRGKKNKTLPAPVEKPVADRIRRSTGYDKVKEDLTRWEPVVTANRQASTLSFPLPIVEEPFGKKKEAGFNFKVKTDLAKELEELWAKNTKADDEDKMSRINLTYEEMVTRRDDMAKLRAQQSYAESKARRQGKIKSKSYHRVKKKATIKQKVKDFEELMKADPDEAKKQLEHLEKIRAQERAQLRHRNTGKWAQKLQVKAKTDKEIRKVLSEQLALSRELTQKHKIETDSEDEASSEDDLEGDKNLLQNSQADDNPWTNAEEKVGDFLSNYRKFWEAKNAKQSNVKAQETTDRREKPKLKQHIWSFENPVVCVDTIMVNNGDSMTIDIDPDEEMETSTKKKISDIPILETEISESIDEKNTSQIKEKSLYKNLKTRELIDKNKILTNKHIAKKRKTTPSKKFRSVKRLNAGTDTWTVDSLSEEDDNTRSDEEEYNSLANDKNIENDNLEFFKNQKTHDQKIEALKELVKSTKKSSTKKSVHQNYAGIDMAKLTKSVSLPSAFSQVLEAVDADESEEAQGLEMGVQEVFEDDDNEADFKKKQQEEEDRNKIAPIDQFLPGWGNWAGPGINYSKKKRNRFLIKFPTDSGRKKKREGNVITNSKANRAVKPFLLNEIPFPFKSVADYEKSIAQPIGQTFVPETAFGKMTEPALTTKIGAVIEPMTEDVLLQHQKKKSYCKV